ncbi:MAG: sulfatase [Acidobacteriota bacterium]
MAALYNKPRFSRALLPAVFWALLSVCACSEPAPARPNILAVVISGLRADHVSAYGYGRQTTPSLDALAASGTVYETALAASAWRLASQASMMTGRYPSEHDVGFDHPVLDDGLMTLAERMKAAGYATLAVTTDSAIGRANGFAQGFDEFVEIRPEEQGSVDDGAALAETALYDGIHRFRLASPRTPIFAYLILKNPTLPFGPPEEYRRRFLEKPFPLPRLEELSELWIPFARQLSAGLASLSPEDREAMVALYDGEIAYADYRLGRILQTLSREGLRERTVVIVTSDIGEDLTDHGLLADASNLYDSMIRVPLVVNLPGTIPQGVRVPGQVRTLDFAQAVLKLASDPPLPTPVRDLFAQRPVVISEARFDPGAIRYLKTLQPAEDYSCLERNLVGVRTPDYKFVLTSRDTSALFDLKADPGEQRSIAEKHPARVREMDTLVGRWSAALRPRPVGPRSPAAAAATSGAGAQPAGPR